jgi:hypothetical protein
MKYLSFFPILLLQAAIMSQAWAAPVTFNTALPISEGVFLYRQQLRWQSSADDPSGMNREMDAQVAISVLGYGINSKLAVFGVVPWVDKSLEMTVNGNAIERDNRGMGDAKVFARYTFWQDDAQGRTFRAAAFGGLTAPTGKDDETDRFGRLPPSLQNGSGTWNGFGGVVATWQSMNFEIDGEISYEENREANNFEAGDESRLNFSWQRWYWPSDSSRDAGFLYGVEFNWLHRGQNKVGGQKEANSGGDTLWLAPTLQYVTQRYILEMALQKPVVQDLNGTALENDLIAITSVRFIF